MLHPIACCQAFLSVPGIGRKTLFDFRNQIAGIDSFRAAFSLLMDMQKKFPGRIRSLPDEGAFLEVLSSSQLILEKQEDMDIHSFFFTDPRFPVSLLDLSVPSIFFFYKGNISALEKKCLAMIGSRSLSPILEKVGIHAGSFAASHGWAVVSGLALGADTALHRGGLDAHGILIGVLPTSLEKVYPSQNRVLSQSIIDTGGCLLSEYPLGTNASPARLVERDRLQSGIARGIFVLAAKSSGGSWHAIQTAKALNLPIGFFDFRSFPAYSVYSDFVQGIDRLVHLGAFPVSNSALFTEFLNRCNSVSCCPRFSPTSLF